VLRAIRADNTTLKDFLCPHRGAIRQGAPDLLMTEGVPTEACWPRCALPIRRCSIWSARRRGVDPAGEGLVDKPWHDARRAYQVKLLPQDGELYVFAQSTDRVAKERAMRRRQLKWLWGRLKQWPA